MSTRHDTIEERLVTLEDKMASLTEQVNAYFNSAVVTNNITHNDTRLTRRIVRNTHPP